MAINQISYSNRNNWSPQYRCLDSIINPSNLINKIVKVVTNALETISQIAEVSCVYCEEKHLFDNCPRNLASVNYVGNLNRKNQKHLY